VSQLQELTEQECWSLIDQQVDDARPHFARVGWTGASGPLVIPVNYVVHERSLWIRTSAYSAMAEEVDESLIAVEMDDIDAETHAGWSVLLRGRAAVIYHEHQVPEEVRNLQTWAGGARPLWVHLAHADVSGRRLG